MSRGIKEVRKSIMRRKRMRNIHSNKSATRQVLPTFPQDEEKHGYISNIPDYQPQTKQKKHVLLSGMVIKGILSIILFFAITFLLTTNADMLSKPKSWTKQALTEEFPFARVNHWYQQTFGSPLAFNPKSDQVGTDEHSLDLPVSGNVTETFQANGTGIMIAPEEAEQVYAWNDGIIIFAGKDRETDKTIIIQHADNSKTKYGHLSSVDVHLYQYVAPGQRLGVFNPTEANQTVYFSIEKDNKFIDPVQVMQVDDRK